MAEATVDVMTLDAASRHHLHPPHRPGYYWNQIETQNHCRRVHRKACLKSRRRNGETAAKRNQPPRDEHHTPGNLKVPTWYLCIPSYQCYTSNLDTTCS